MKVTIFDKKTFNDSVESLPNGSIGKLWGKPHSVKPQFNGRPLMKTSRRVIALDTGMGWEFDQFDYWYNFVKLTSGSTITLEA